MPGAVTGSKVMVRSYFTVAHHVSSARRVTVTAIAPGLPRTDEPAEHGLPGVRGADPHPANHRQAQPPGLQPALLPPLTVYRALE